jgi:multiple sugar transport system substrate-binding protein
MRKIMTGLLAGVGLMWACGTSAQAQELTIFWAEWDPANYLQELVNEYEAETGVKVTVETTPWADFQTKAFTEFNAKGSAYDMVVGDSQWIGAASEAGHYVDLTEFFTKHNLNEVMAPATVKYYAEYPANSKKYWSIPAEGDAVGWSYRKDWFEDPKEMEAFKAKYGYDLAPPKTWTEMRDIAEFFHRPDQKRYGIAIYTDNSYDGLVMGVENAIFSYGGELGDYQSYKVDGIINSEKNVKALEMYRELYGGDEHELLRLLPGSGERGVQPECQGYRLLCQSGRPGRRAVRSTRRPGHLGHLLFGQPGRGDEIPRMVHQGRHPEALGRTRRLHGKRQGA